MIVSQQQFEEVMDDCMNLLQPLMRQLSQHDEVFTSITIGILIGSFLTTRRTVVDRNDAVQAIHETVNYVDELQEMRRRNLQ